jgi:hypothetical protein
MVMSVSFPEAGFASLGQCNPQAVPVAFYNVCKR